MNDNRPDIVRIAFTGKMRSGKTSAADYLWIERGFEKISFASPIYRIVDDLFGTDENGKQRELLQAVGQKMREIDPDVWIRQAEKSLRIYEDYLSTKGVVIDDLRQPNEYEWARANGFKIVRMISTRGTRKARAKMLNDIYGEQAFEHETEQYSDKFEVDYEIFNNGGNIDVLKRQVDEIIGEIKAKGGR